MGHTLPGVTYFPKRTQPATSGTISSQQSGVGAFSSIAFPVMRRVFAGLIANDLVSVQPMTAPSSNIFFMDYQYGNIGNKLRKKLRMAGLIKGKKKVGV